jgi:F420-dependent oxidoreductase-like protein
MRIGLQIAPERGRHREKVTRLVADAKAAESAGFDTIWVPQIPDDFDALTALALMAYETSRIELGTAVLPIQSRHPVAMAQQVLSTQAVCEGRLSLGLGVSHDWVVERMFGLSYERPARLMRDYLEVMGVALAGPGPVDVENESYRVHNPLDITDLTPTPILIAALGPVMLKLAGQCASGTILWMADERAVGEHIAPTISKAAEQAGRPAPRVVAGVPVTVCRGQEVDEVRAWANRVFGHADYSPNYQRLLERGDAADIGDLAVVGDESQVRQRLQRFRDAGVTDLAARVLPFGANREGRLESHTRTGQFLAALSAEF